ncbi:hypothetical protein ABKV19_023157 [Rosa sericea]
MLNFVNTFEQKIRTYTQQLLLGLQYLHQKEITHGDIKGANILIDADGCIKLADFGLSKQGAQLWMAPEVLLQKDLHNCRFTDKPDIWSVGCTVIEMATGDPWRGNYHAGASFLKHMEKSDSVPPIPDNLSSYGKQFLGRCLQREPNLRASASQLLEDPFITRQNFRHPSGGGTVVGAIAAPVIYQQRIVTPAAPKHRLVIPAAPKQRLVIPAAPKQRLVIPAAPKQRLVIPAALLPSNALLPHPHNALFTQLLHVLLLVKLPDLQSTPVLVHI